MLTILFYLTCKPGCEEATRALAVEMTRATRAEGAGCISYRFHQLHDEPQRWFLYEQWRDKEALRSHITNMKRLFGEPPAGARLPERLHVLTESFRAVPCDVVE